MAIKVFSLSAQHAKPYFFPTLDEASRADSVMMMVTLYQETSKNCLAKKIIDFRSSRSPLFFRLLMRTDLRVSVASAIDIYCDE